MNIWLNVMRKFSVFIVGVVAILIASCSSKKFHTTRVESTDFAQFKTYAWLTPVDSLSKDYYSNDIAKSKILSTANNDLEARGLTYSKNDPDLLFRYIAIVNNRSKEIYGNYSVGFGMGGPWGWYRPWGPYFGYTTSFPVGKERVRYGHIIIEALDRRTNSVVWQARGTSQVNDPEAAINDIPKLINGIMKEYPIKAKK